MAINGRRSPQRQHWKPSITHCMKCTDCRISDPKYVLPSDAMVGWTGDLRTKTHDVSRLTCILFCTTLLHLNVWNSHGSLFQDETVKTTEKQNSHSLKHMILLLLWNQAGMEFSWSCANGNKTALHWQNLNREGVLVKIWWWRLIRCPKSLIYQIKCFQKKSFK